MSLLQYYLYCTTAIKGWNFKKKVANTFTILKLQMLEYFIKELQM